MCHEPRLPLSAKSLLSPEYCPTVGCEDRWWSEFYAQREAIHVRDFASLDEVGIELGGKGETLSKVKFVTQAGSEK
jgi:hypothetical protein